MLGGSQTLERFQVTLLPRRKALTFGARQRLDEGRDHGRHADGYTPVPVHLGARSRGRPPLRAGAQHSAQLLHIIGAARLRPGAEARALPSTEGLPPDDGPRRRPVHVQVTGPHALDELRLLTFVEAVEAGSEAVSGAVGEPERVGKILRGQHGEQRTEELRAMDVAAGRGAQGEPWAEGTGGLRGARGPG